MPSTESVNESQLLFEGFAINVQRRGLYRGEERVHLTPTPFKALLYLVQNRGLVVSKEQLLSAVWGGQRDENAVEQAIRQIRRALGDEIDQPRFIQTISGEGYCFVAQVKEADQATPEHESDSEVTIVPKDSKAKGNVRWINGKVAFISAIGISILLIAAIAFRQNIPGVTAENPTKITRSQSHILSPLLSDGEQIYYPRYENGRYSVAAVRIEGGQSTVVVTNISNPELCDLTVDGEMMLLRNLLRSRDETEPLYVQPKAGPAQRVGDILAYDAAWYPNSRRILFSADGVVYATDATGKSRQQLFSVPGNAFWFRWSIDGQRLRFTVIDKKSEETSIWEAAADGKEPHRLFPELKYHLCCGSWTPDGKLFIFQARVGSTFQIWAQRDQDDTCCPIAVDRSL